MCSLVLPGDLTDAKFQDLRGSKQFPDEWETYHEVVKKCKEKVKTWLDIRGNHGILIHKQPPIICSRRQFQNLLLFQE